MARPTRVSISLEAIRHNYTFAVRLAPLSKSIAVVKADAYGHGATVISKALEPQVPAFAVACIEEAIALREAGIKKPILLLEGIFSADEVNLASMYNFWMMVGNQQQVDAVVSAKISKPVVVWIKVDTGMHRLGVSPVDVKKVYANLANSANVNSEMVIATHFACSDELDSHFTYEQINRFQGAVAGLHAPISMANSAAILGWEKARADWNRPGYMLYGNSPFPYSHAASDQLKPAMTFQSAVINIREIEAGESVGYGLQWQADRTTKVATVAVGYGDGYPRNAPNGTPVLVNGQRVPLIGCVSMDMITLDVTELADVEIGDEVILWGKQLPVNEVAKWTGASGYELLTRMPKRAPRIYTDH
ncbi:MAG: alanine racemase [Pseudomonadales bacterium]|nr:alanine racemase [Pseudomonadales bacterium]MCP5216461.1 alanine racemase [Pseudomonadales bacterium]